MGKVSNSLKLIDVSLNNKPFKRKLSDFSVLITFIALTIVGFAFTPLLNISLKPNKQLRQIVVEFWWPNAAASVIEVEVTSKLERLLNGITGLEEIVSISKKEVGTITLSFDKETDIDIVNFEISTLIRRIYPELPTGVSYPSIRQGYGNRREPLLQYSISAPSNTQYISEYAKANLVPALSSMKGVEKVEVYGATPYEFKIKYSPSQLETYHLRLTDVIKTIQSYLEEKSLGRIKLNSESAYYTTVFLQNYNSDELDWNKIPIATVDGKILYLSNIAKVDYQEGVPNNYHRINGFNNVNLVVYAGKGSNALQLSSIAKSKISQLQKTLPQGFSINLEHDESEYIGKELETIGFRTVATLIILLLFVLLITGRFSYLILIFFSLTINLSLAIFCFYVFKIDIHLYSLAGLTISMGIIIDNSIVMIEHYRVSPSKKVFTSILAATLTTIGALSVVFLLEEEQIVNLSDFTWVVVITLTTSLFISYLFIPSFLNKHPIAPSSSRWAPYSKRIIIKFNDLYIKFIYFAKKWKWAIIIALVLGFGVPIHLLPEKIKGETVWTNVYNNTLASDVFISKIKEPLSVYLGGSMRLFTEYVYDNNGFSDPQQTKLYVIGKMQEGCTVQQLNDALKLMEDYIGSFDEIDKYVTSVNTYQFGSIEITFKKEYETTFPYTLKNKLISQAINYGGVQWSVFGVGLGFSNQTHSGYKPYRIVLEGYNYNKLYEYASRLRDSLVLNHRVMDVEIVGEVDWSGSKNLSEYALQVDKRKMADLNISHEELYLTLQNQLTHSRIGQVIHKKQNTSILIEPDNFNTFNLWWLRNYNWKIGNGFTKISDYTTIEKHATGNDIYKINQQYRLNVAWDYMGPGKLAKKVTENELQNLKANLPVGFNAYSDQWMSWNKEEKGQYELILVILVIIFIICAITFESLSLSLAVLLLVPVSFIGVFLSFYLFDIGFDQGGFASFILLSGLTVNSAIYILTEYINLPNRTNRIQNYIKAFNHKATPIFLTILSTILGMIPFVWSGQNEVFWYSFAVGTIGGLIFSIIGIFIYLPLFIKLEVHE